MFPRRAIVATVLAALALPAVASAEPVTAPVETWVPDGEVESFARSGSTLYIGGNFSRIARYTGSSALFSPSSNEARKPWPEVNGVVNAVESDGAGGWYLGGDFRSVGGVPRTDLAHVLADRSVDPDWAPSTNGYVRVLQAPAGPGEPVFAGGEFTAANGVARGHLASFDRTTGALGDFSGSVAHSNQFTDFKGVHSMLLRGTTLFVGGIFDSASCTARLRGAAFDVTNSALLNFDPQPNGTVTGIVQLGSDLFIGGRFTQVGGQTRHGVARVSANTGAPDASWVAPTLAGTSLSALAGSGDWLYLGGTVNVGPGQTRTAAAYHRTSAGINNNWSPVTTGGVTSITATPSVVYLGSGSFTDGPRSALIGVHPTTFDGATETPSFAPALGRGRQQFPSGGTSGVRAIGVSGSDVVAGGTFTNVGGVDRRNLAAIDLSTGRATSFDPPMRGNLSAFGSVDALAVTDDGLVWAGGQFATEGPNPRNSLAAFDTSTGALASFRRDPNGQVLSLAASGSTAYVGGSFTTVGGMARGFVAQVRNVPGQTGEVLPFDVDANGAVRALALRGDTLFMGGAFTEVNTGLAALTRTRNRLAAIDAATGLARPWDPDANGDVHALALDGDTVYAGGDFARINGTVDRGKLAAVDDQTGAARPWAPVADGLVRALAARGPTVFAGGDFGQVNGASRTGLAAVDSQSGALDPFALDLDTEERGGPLPPVKRVDALDASDANGLLIGGTFVMSTPSLRSANLGRFGLPALPQPAGPGEQPGGGGPDAGPAVTLGDSIAPGLSALSASVRSFRVAPGATPSDGTAVAAAAKKKKRPPRGTTLTLRLSEAARVKFEVLAKGKGRRVGSRCVKATKRNRRRKRCTLLTPRGAFTRSAPLGGSKVKWSGRIGRKALKRGSYVLRATPTDAAGNTGRARSLSFKIVR